MAKKGISAIKMEMANFSYEIMILFIKKENYAQ